MSPHSVIVMPDHYSKWKLNKSEQKQVDEEEKALIAQLVGAGKTQQEAESQASQAKDAQVKALRGDLINCFGAFIIHP